MTYLLFEVTNAVLRQFFFAMVVCQQALCTLHTVMKFAHFVDMRLNIRHRPCLANKELVNSSPVIDTETR